MTSRMRRCSFQASAMACARLRPRPSISSSRRGWASITVREESPKRATMRPAMTGPIPLISPEPR